MDVPSGLIRNSRKRLTLLKCVTIFIMGKIIFLNLNLNFCSKIKYLLKSKWVFAIKKSVTETNFSLTILLQKLNYSLEKQYLSLNFSWTLSQKSCWFFFFSPRWWPHKSGYKMSINYFPVYWNSRLLFEALCSNIRLLKVQLPYLLMAHHVAISAPQRQGREGHPQQLEFCMPPFSYSPKEVRCCCHPRPPQPDNTFTSTPHLTFCLRKHFSYFCYRVHIKVPEMENCATTNTNF